MGALSEMSRQIKVIYQRSTRGILLKLTIKITIKLTTSVCQPNLFNLKHHMQHTVTASKCIHCIQVPSDPMVPVHQSHLFVQIVLRGRLRHSDGTRSFVMPSIRFIAPAGNNITPSKRKGGR